MGVNLAAAARLGLRLSRARLRSSLFQLLGLFFVQPGEKHETASEEDGRRRENP